MPRRSVIRTGLIGLGGLVAPQLLRIDLALGAGNSEGRAAAIPVPAAGKVVPTTAAGLATAYANAAPGTTIVVAPGGTFGGTLTLNKDGNASAPIVIRVGTWNGSQVVDPPSFPAATITRPVTVSGDYNWLRGFNLAGGFNVINGTTKARFNRCLIKGNSDDTGTGTSIDWCEFADMQDVFLQHLPKNGCRTPFVYRCYFHDQTANSGDSGVFHQVGQGNPDAPFACNAWVLECLYGAGGTAGEGFESKSTGNVFERCATVAPQTEIVRCIVRCGENNQILACYTASTGGPKGCIGVRGPGHRIADCGGPNGPIIGPFGGNISYASWKALTDKSGKYPRAEGCVVTRVRNPTLGFNPSAGDDPPVGTILEACTGTVTYLNGTPRPSTRSPTIPARTDPGAVAWRATVSGGLPAQVGPKGVYNASD